MKRWILRLLNALELCMSVASCEPNSLRNRDPVRQRRGSMDGQKKKGKQDKGSHRKDGSGSSKHKKRTQSREAIETKAEQIQKPRMIRGISQNKIEMKHFPMIRGCEDRKTIEIKHIMERQKKRQKEKRELDSAGAPIWKRRNFPEPLQLLDCSKRRRSEVEV